ncbi:hypothetical protein JXA85_02810 [Candidatus Woesearchaeota archaeon]|nr:hypothetical protein [Candidatus Woesearchaeota archaeon]
MLKILYNLRPYSWIDLILIGMLAKFSVTRKLVFNSNDLVVAIALLSLWFFYQFLLERKHSYLYRGCFKLLPTIVTLVIPIVISILSRPISIVYIALSTLLIIAYLQKNRSALLGSLSSAVRGLIQVCYFLYAGSLYSADTSFILGFSIFLLYTSRAIMGDIRDYRHNKNAGKNTLVVNLGIGKSLIIMELLLLLVVVSLANFPVIIPVILFGLGVLFYRNGYIMHQLMIHTTSFTWINLIAYHTYQNLVFTNLIYLGVFLNTVFYPLLKRKSNPEFK